MSYMYVTYGHMHPIRLPKHIGRLDLRPW